MLLFCKAPEPEPDSFLRTNGVQGDDVDVAPPEEAIGTTVVTIIGVVIAAVTVVGAAAVVLQGKTSVEKAEKARDAAAAGGNRCAEDCDQHSLPVCIAHEGDAALHVLTYCLLMCLDWS